MKLIIPTRLLIIFLLVFLCSSSIIAQSGNEELAAKSRVTVVSNDTATRIWVTNFPKKVTVMVFDNHDNLLSIVSTNAYGSACITLPNAVKDVVYAKTINGEISVSNKEVVQGVNQQMAAAREASTSAKA